MTYGLKGKMLLLTGAISMVTLATGAIAFIYSEKTKGIFTQILEDDVPSIRATNRMLLAFRLARIELLQMIAPGTSIEMAESSAKAIEEEWAKFDKDLAAIKSFRSSDEEKKLLEEFESAIQIGRSDFDKALALFRKNPTEDSAERREMAKIIVQDLKEHGKRIKAATQGIVDHQANSIVESTAHANNEAKKGILISLVSTILGTILGFIASLLIATKITSQVQQATRVIFASSQELALTASSIATSSEQLAQSATEQAASLQETSASLEEINAMVAKSADNAKASESNSVDSQMKAQTGQKSVDAMLKSMQQISLSNDEIMSQIKKSNTEIGEIVQVIQEIGTKTKVINEIVFQTKLLSFNASVEAARAGEHGKGFAVVAEEVGHLAQMSGNAAKEITEMLDSSIAKVQSIVATTNAQVESLVSSAKQRVDKGYSVANECATVLGEIVQETDKVKTLVAEISTASREQSLGVEEINKAMGQLETVTQQNSTASEAVAHAAQKLAEQSNILKNAIQRLNSTVQGASLTENPTPASMINPSAPVAELQNVKVLDVKLESEEKQSLRRYKSASGDPVPRHEDTRFMEDV